MGTLVFFGIVIGADRHGYDATLAMGLVLLKFLPFSFLCERRIKRKVAEAEQETN